MDPFRGLGLPRIPGLSELVEVLQAQTEALAQLPRTIADLNGAVRELIAATRVATETIASAQRTAERLEGLVEELEEPVRALRPGLDRVGRVLDDPAVDTLPGTLRAISDDVLPLLHGLRQATDRLGSVTDRVGAIPGLLRRRGRPEEEGPSA
ncbi:hypothetical protein [Geodermatophilus marinus]|uniref:hypothetical protein n=1 Tax=Geodermatophilus sp. LHW52908 TaxID=2303986 RepID=UPI000E3D1B35|nr:hypothetical protein [Geodermatophilus sp. LHW52908]RFU18922.1 hypothetical protein D0Z06_24055 [Geodermatophilus sp. LHW52908]